jgi:hypothetical protein
MNVAMMQPSDSSQPELAPELSPELRRLSVWMGEPTRREITAESVGRFVAATDPDRRARSEGSTSEPAAVTDIAPATYFCPDPVVTAMAMGLQRPAHPPRSIDGGSTWELGEPVRVGDVLTLVSQVSALTHRKTRDGRDLVQTEVRVSAWNQHGRWVGRATGTIVNYEERA